MRTARKRKAQKHEDATLKFAARTIKSIPTLPANATKFERMVHARLVRVMVLEKAKKQPVNDDDSAATEDKSGGGRKKPRFDRTVTLGGKKDKGGEFKNGSKLDKYKADKKGTEPITDPTLQVTFIANTNSSLSSVTTSALLDSGAQANAVGEGAAEAKLVEEGYRGKKLKISSPVGRACQECKVGVVDVKVCSGM
jgi:hypothetical protein